MTAQEKDKYFRFTEWCGYYYIRAVGGWWGRYEPQDVKRLKDTDYLWKLFCVQDRL